MGVASLVLAAVSCAAALVLLLPTLSDVTSVVVAMTRRTARAAKRPSRPPRLIFLIAAHDEEFLIESCVRSLRGLRYPATGRRIVVVADNCHDRTAALAKGAGATVLERIAPDLPGKPQALAWAFAQLPLDQYDAVVIVDADAVLDPEFAVALAAHAPLADKVVQCYDDVRNPDDSAITRMATILSAGRFRGAFPLKAAAGLTIPLSDGMCLGTGVLRQHGWRAFGLSEDCEAYARLTAQGVPIELEPAAHLYAAEARSLRESTTQRQRWLAGRLQAVVRVGPALLRSRHANWHQRLDVLAELAAPGPALAIGGAATLAALLWAVSAPGAIAIIALLAATLLRPVAYALVGLWHHPTPARAALSFVFLPVYALWRLGIVAGSLKLLHGGAWVRTDRKGQRALTSNAT